MQQTIDRRISSRNQQHAYTLTLLAYNCLRTLRIRAIIKRRKEGKKSIQTRYEVARNRMQLSNHCWPFATLRRGGSIIERHRNGAIKELESAISGRRVGENFNFPVNSTRNFIVAKGRTLTNEESRENRVAFSLKVEPASEILSRARHKSPVSLTGRRSSLSLPTFRALKVLCALGNTWMVICPACL